MNQNNHLHFQVSPGLMPVGVSAQQSHQQQLNLTSSTNLPVINGNSMSCSAPSSNGLSAMNNQNIVQQFSALLGLDQSSLLAMIGINPPPATTSAVQQFQQQSHLAHGIPNQSSNQLRMPNHPLHTSPHTSQNRNSDQLPHGLPNSSLLPSSLSTVYGPQAHLFNTSSSLQRLSATPSHTQSQPNAFPTNSHQLMGVRPQNMATSQVQQQILAQQQSQQQMLARMSQPQQQQTGALTTSVQNQKTPPSLNQNQAQNDLLLLYAMEMEKQQKQQILHRQQLEVLQRLSAQETVMQSQASAPTQAQAASKHAVMNHIPPTTVESLLGFTRGSPQSLPSIPSAPAYAQQQQHQMENMRKRTYEMLALPVEKQHELLGLASSPPKIPYLNMLSQSLVPTSSTSSSPIKERKRETQDDDEVIVVDDNESPLTMPKLTPEAEIKPDKQDVEPTANSMNLNEQIETHMLRLSSNLEKEKCKTTEGIHPELNFYGIFATIPSHIVHKMLDDILNTTPV